MKASTARQKAPLEFLGRGLPEEELPWCSVNVGEVLRRNKRLEASFFGVEGRRAREVLKQCKWPLRTIAGKGGIGEAYHRPRFKRIWVAKSNLPIYQPSQILEINPKAGAYLSDLTRTDVEALRVHKGQVLLTCSGTLGNCTLVSETLNNAIFSHDLIRINVNGKFDNGYLYAYLRTDIGKALIQTNEYGAVVSHMEPEHLEIVPIPDPAVLLKKKIHDLVIRSFSLRDKSNKLLNEAETMLCNSLNLPRLEKLRPEYFERNVRLRNYRVKLSSLASRIDGSYHVPIVKSILRVLKKGAAEVTNVGDSRISKRIILPGRFARVYVREGQGTVFFGGKQIFELDPSNKKYLSLVHHKKRIKEELVLEENMVMITCSGTIGKVELVPKHWEGWTANQHIIRVVPASKDIAGFLYVYLATDYGRELIKRYTYGAVVDEIDDRHVAQVPVPILRDQKSQCEINRLALGANLKRTEAYYAEQEAVRLTNEEVIYKKGHQ